MGTVGVMLLFAGDGAIAEKQGAELVQRAVIKIDNLTCGGCFNAINGGLGSLKGYDGMGTNLFRKLIAVDFKSPLTVEEITKKLSDLGYPGTVESVDPVQEKETFAYLESLRNSSGQAGSCCMGNQVQGKTSGASALPACGAQGNGGGSFKGATRGIEPSKKE